MGVLGSDVAETSCIVRGGRVPRTGGSGVGGGRGVPIRRAVGPVLALLMALTAVLMAVLTLVTGTDASQRR